jgi:hypothetical protein
MINLKDEKYWEKMNTDQLLIAMPENWIIYKDSGWWAIWNDDFSIQFESKLDHSYSLRPLLIEFLSQHDFNEENDITLWRMQIDLNKNDQIVLQ